MDPTRLRALSSGTATPGEEPQGQGPCPWAHALLDPPLSRSRARRQKHRHRPWVTCGPLRPRWVLRVR